MTKLTPIPPVSKTVLKSDLRYHLAYALSDFNSDYFKVLRPFSTAPTSKLEYCRFLRTETMISSHDSKQYIAVYYAINVSADEECDLDSDDEKLLAMGLAVVERFPKHDTSKCLNNAVEGIISHITERQKQVNGS